MSTTVRMHNEISNSAYIKHQASISVKYSDVQYFTFIFVSICNSPHTLFLVQVKVAYLDGRPVTSGTVNLEVFQSHFNRNTSTRLLQNTYSIDSAGGLIVVSLGKVSAFAKSLQFTVFFQILFPICQINESLRSKIIIKSVMIDIVYFLLRYMISLRKFQILNDKLNFG